MDDSSDKQTAQETVPVSEAGRKRPVTGLLAREFGELAAVCRRNLRARCENGSPKAPMEISHT